MGPQLELLVQKNWQRPYKALVSNSLHQLGMAEEFLAYKNLLKALLCSSEQALSYLCDMYTS